MSKQLNYIYYISAQKQIIYIYYAEFCCVWTDTDLTLHYHTDYTACLKMLQISLSHIYIYIYIYI